MAYQPALSETSTTGTLTAAAQTVELDVTAYSSGIVLLSGTWVATVQFEYSLDGTNYISAQGYPRPFDTNNTQLPATSSTGNTQRLFALGGVKKLRTRASAYTSGTVTVTIRASIAPSSFQHSSLVGIESSSNAVVAINTVAPADAVSFTYGLAGVSIPLLYNGSTYDLGREIKNATNSTGTGIAAAGLVGQFDDVSPTSITENQFGNVRMSGNRNLYGTIRDAAGNERGVNVNASNQMSVSVDNTVTVGSHAVTNAGTFPVQAAGDVAAGSTDSGSPVKAGGVGRTTNPTAVTDGQRANFITDKLGKQVVVGSIRDLKGDQTTTITSSTTETTIVTAAGASIFADVYLLTITNTSATGCEVTIRDVTAGGTAQSIYVPATDTRGFALSESAARKQGTANSAWTATCGTSVASIKVYAAYVKNT